MKRFFQILAIAVVLSFSVSSCAILEEDPPVVVRTYPYYQYYPQGVYLAPYWYNRPYTYPPGPYRPSYRPNTPPPRPNVHRPDPRPNRPNGPSVPAPPKQPANTPNNNHRTTYGHR